jgi:hypothetical protein
MKGTGLVVMRGEGSPVSGSTIWSVAVVAVTKARPPLRRMARINATRSRPPPLRLLAASMTPVCPPSRSVEVQDHHVVLLALISSMALHQPRRRSFPGSCRRSPP